MNYGSICSRVAEQGIRFIPPSLELISDSVHRIGPVFTFNSPKNCTLKQAFLLLPGIVVPGGASIARNLLQDASGGEPHVIQPIKAGFKHEVVGLVVPALPHSIPTNELRATNMYLKLSGFSQNNLGPRLFSLPASKPNFATLS